MPSPTPQSHPKPWEEKNRWVAGILAFLIPGAGHLYQGRTVKGLIYFCSILGLFFWGHKMGEGMVVYNTPDKAGPRPLRRVALSYAAQFGTGAVALPALVQNQRAMKNNSIARKLNSPLTDQFQGTLYPVANSETGRLVGTIHLDPVESQFGSDFKGTFEGTLDGQPVKLTLGGSRFELDRRIKAGFQRRLECSVVDTAESSTVPRWISGSIPRSILNAYGSPPDPEQLQEINGRLGKIYELALVFTWIAGLLNILAIWDCVLGPAYGFGDEHLQVRTAESGSTASPPPPLESPPGAKEDPPRAESRPTQKSPV